MRKLAALILLIALSTTACWPWTEWSTDSNQQPPVTHVAVSDVAFVDDVQFIYLESYPVQVRAIVSGSLPTPCHTLVWSISENDAGADVTVYSAVDPGASCAQVLEPFEVTIDVGSFETGDYTLTVNEVAYGFSI